METVDEWLAERKQARKKHRREIKRLEEIKKRPFWTEKGNLVRMVEIEGYVFKFYLGEYNKCLDIYAFEIDATYYAEHHDSAGGTGVTKVFYLENVPQATIGIGANESGQSTYNVRYRRMKGKY